MVQKADKREEDLRGLADMIAKAYRSRVTGEPVQPLNVSLVGGEAAAIEAEMMVRTELPDFRPRHVYAETVKVEDFTGKKVNRVGKKDSKGG